MMRFFSTIERHVRQVDSLNDGKGPWIHLQNPTSYELDEVVSITGAHREFLKAALDEEEQPRLEFEEGQALVLVNVPIKREELRYDTIPLGIVIGDSFIATVCLEPNVALDSLISGNRVLNTAKRTRFLLQLLYAVAVDYLRYLKQIERKTDEIEGTLLRSQRNKELIDMLALTKGLVYFTTSLRANQAVMEKLLRSHLRKDPENLEASPVIRMYADDEDLLEDVITENRQAIEMADVYTSILNGMMDAFASIISNNLNIVMKFLASVTILLAIPTIVASVYGMNVHLPGQDSPWAFGGIVLASVFFTAVVAWGLARRRMM